MYKNNLKIMKMGYYMHKGSINDSLIVALKQRINIKWSFYNDDQVILHDFISNKPDFLLIDIDGIHEPVFKLLQELRSPAVCKQVKFPVLILGSGVNERITFQLSDSGADGFLKKPFNLGLLISRVNQLLTQDINMVEKGGVMLPVPRVKYEGSEKKSIEREVHTWLV